MKYVSVFIGLVICLISSGQTNPKYVDTDYELSDISYNGVSLDQLNTIDDNKSPLNSLLPSFSESSSEPHATWGFTQQLPPGTLSLGVDKILYLYWYEEAGDDWLLSNLSVLNDNSTFTFGNQTVKVGQSLDVLNANYPVSDLKSRSLVDSSKHRVLIRMPEIGAGVNIFFNPQTDIITEIRFGRQIH